MKLLLEKFLKHQGVLIFFFAATAWALLFRNFLTAKIDIVGDAVPYYEHIKFFIESILKGTYPLWDYVRDFGTANEFFLRRIGEFNPFYGGIALLMIIGIKFNIAYQLFNTFYFLLGATGMYALAGLYLKDERSRAIAAAFFILSGLGTLPFQTYLMLMIVPYIWFAYFVCAHIQKPKVFNIYGMVFCFGLVVTTYIPFYFLTVCLTGLISFVLVYFKDVIPLGRGVFYRFTIHRGAWIFGGIFLILALLPGYFWFGQSAKGEMFFPIRHRGVQTTQAAQVHINMINEGGIVGPMIYDQSFFDLDRRKLGDCYIPIFGFLILLSAVFCRLTRRSVFLFCWAMMLYLIGIADGSVIHGFLYKHVFFMKYFRNVQYFFWLGVLPIFIFLMAEVLDVLIKSLKEDNGRRGALVGIVMAHAGAMLFFFFQEGPVIASAYATIFLSAAFLLCLVYGQIWMRFISLLLFLGALLISPIEVYVHMMRNHPVVAMQSPYNQNYMDFTLAQSQDINQLVQKGELRKIAPPYLSTKYFHSLFKEVDASILEKYLQARLLLYDHIEPLNEEMLNFQRLRYNFQTLENLAFAPLSDLSGLPFTNGTIGQEQAHIVTNNDENIKVKRFGANELVLESHLVKPQFLVYNNVYHSKWSVYVDGKKQKLIRANFAFCGLWIKDGIHQIRFIYGEPWEPWFGVFMMLVFASMLGVFVYMMIRRQ